MSDVDEWTNQVHRGDALDLLGELPAESVHAVVTDPPYGMAFMPDKNAWDSFDTPSEYQSWCESWGRKVLRVLKPGGHCIACGGDRTHHRLYSGIEDAGFEIRHTLPWLFANNFPKNTDALLKPAAEFPVLARKPIEGTLAENTGEYGVGALNVDDCRIPIEDGDDGGNWSGGEAGEGNLFYQNDSGFTNQVRHQPEGRYPATVTLDEGAARMLDAQTGVLERGDTDFSRHESRSIHGRAYGEPPDESERTESYYNDRGGASRFFYVAKADEAERTLEGRIQNEHPTVKPISLIEWHIRLISQPGQIVCDPFGGSGTTGAACRNTGRQFMLFDKNPEWCAVAQARIGIDVDEPELLLDADQPPIRAYTGGTHE